MLIALPISFFRNAIATILSIVVAFRSDIRIHLNRALSLFLA